MSIKALFTRSVFVCVNVKVCLHLPSPSKFIIDRPFDGQNGFCTHFARQMVRLHSHNVNMTDTVNLTDTVSVDRPLNVVLIKCSSLTQMQKLWLIHPDGKRMPKRRLYLCLKKYNFLFTLSTDTFAQCKCNLACERTFKGCLHVPSRSPSPSKYNIVPEVMVRLTDSMGSVPILSVKRSISIDTMINFDGDGDRDGTCKQAFRQHKNHSIKLRHTHANSKLR